MKINIITVRPLAIQRFGEAFFSAANHFGSPLKVRGGLRFDWLPSFWEFIQFIFETEYNAKTCTKVERLES